MNPDEILEIIAGMDDAALWKIAQAAIEELEQRTMAYRLRLAGQGEEAGLPF